MDPRAETLADVTRKKKTKTTTQQQETQKSDLFLQINTEEPLNTKKNVMSWSVQAVAVNLDDSFLNGNSGGKRNNYPHALFAADVAL